MNGKALVSALTALALAGCAHRRIELPMTSGELAMNPGTSALVAYLGQPDADPDACTSAGASLHDADDLPAGLTAALIAGKVPPQVWGACVESLLPRLDATRAAEFVEEIVRAAAVILADTRAERDPSMRSRRLRALARVYLERAPGGGASGEASRALDDARQRATGPDELRAGEPSPSASSSSAVAGRGVPWTRRRSMRWHPTSAWCSSCGPPAGFRTPHCAPRRNASSSGSASRRHRFPRLGQRLRRWSRSSCSEARTRSRRQIIRPCVRRSRAPRSLRIRSWSGSGRSRTLRRSSAARRTARRRPYCLPSRSGAPSFSGRRPGEAGPSLTVTVKRLDAGHLVYRADGGERPVSAVVEIGDAKSFRMVSRGAPGADGAAGMDGTDGSPGSDGMSASCPAFDGTDGSRGGDGTSGQDGSDGSPGGRGGDVRVVVIAPERRDETLELARVSIATEGGPGGRGGHGGRGGTGGRGGQGGSGATCTDSEGRTTSLRSGMSGTSGLDGSSGTGGRDGPRGPPGVVRFEVPPPTKP